MYRIGSYIPIAGIDTNSLNEIVQQNQTGILGMFNTLSGGSLGRMSIFALSIMPYITASIITQLLSMIYEPFANLKKEGESGRKKINQISRYLTVALAAFQAYGVGFGLENLSTSSGSVVVIPGIFFKITTIITLVVGTMLLMWLGEQISAYGIGNGASLIIFIGIVSGIPSSIISAFELSRKGIVSPLLVIFVCLVIVAMVVLIIFVEQAQRKVVVHYPKKQISNKLYAGDTTHMPLKLNTAGVIPPIFASSLLLFPLTIANFASSHFGALDSISYYLGHGKPLFVVLYASFIIFFSFFYTAVVFNSEETANNLKKYGAYIPGKRPGKATSDYFDYLLTRLTTVGSIYLCIICIIPEFMISKLSLNFALGGTSILIVVNVIIDTFTQVQTYLFSTKYESLVKKLKIQKK